MTTEEVHELALQSAELIRQFLEGQGVSSEVVVVIAPRYDPRAVCTGSTADEEAMNTMLTRSMTRLDPEDERF
jgi:hypothetical protein